MNRRVRHTSSATRRQCRFEVTLVFLSSVLIVSSAKAIKEDPLWPSIDQSEFAQPACQNNENQQDEDPSPPSTPTPLKTLLELKGKSSRSRMKQEGCAEHYNSAEFFGQGGTSREQQVPAMQQSSRKDTLPVNADPLGSRATIIHQPVAPAEVPADNSASIEKESQTEDTQTTMPIDPTSDQNPKPTTLTSLDDIREEVWKKAQEQGFHNSSSSSSKEAVKGTTDHPDNTDEPEEPLVTNKSTVDADYAVSQHHERSMSSPQDEDVHSGTTQPTVPSSVPPSQLYVGSSSAAVVPNYNDAPSSLTISPQGSNTKQVWMTALFQEGVRETKHTKSKEKKKESKTTPTTLEPVTHPPELSSSSEVLPSTEQPPAAPIASNTDDSSDQKKITGTNDTSADVEFSAEDVQESGEGMLFPSAWPSTISMIVTSPEESQPTNSLGSSTKHQHHIQARKKAAISTEEEKTEQDKVEETYQKHHHPTLGLQLFSSTPKETHSRPTTATSPIQSNSPALPPGVAFQTDSKDITGGISPSESMTPSPTTVSTESTPSATMFPFTVGDEDSISRTQRQHQTKPVVFETLRTPAAGVKMELTVEQLTEYIDNYSEEVRVRSNRKAQAAWDYSTNITQEHSERKINATLDLAAWKRSEWKNNITHFDYSGVLEREGSHQLKRMYKMIKNLGMAALDDERMARRTNLITDMQAIYGRARICPFKNQSCNVDVDKSWALEPDLSKVMKKAANHKFKESYDLLSYCWQKWREATGKQMRPKFIEYVRLSNEGALANNDPKIKDTSDLWLDPYESDNFKEEVDNLYTELKPLYQELHGFVRFKLREHYGKDKMSETGPIPAHLLGNMWGQSWEALFPILSEFKAPFFDVTKEMKNQKYSVKRMFETANDFFVGLGLVNVGDGATDFYKRSMLKRPSDGTKVVCHASAWDFMATNALPGDFRVKMCAQVSMKDLVTIHHEMAHIQYYMLYVNQTPLFRSGANPAFHEAIGDTLALSAASTKHLKAIGLLDKNYEMDKISQLAFLLRTALAKIPFLPYSYVVDLYRWKVFNGSIPMDKLNSEWWKLRQKYQGLVPPVVRSEEDFDPGSKYHVAASVPYVRYFVAHILQFSFHQSLCEAAGQFDPKDPQRLPLHMCYIGGNKAAGDKLRKLMQAGSSRHWKDILYDMTGSREMSVKPILNYFKPLRDYLKTYFEVYNIHMGWDQWENLK